MNPAAPISALDKAARPCAQTSPPVAADTQNRFAMAAPYTCPASRSLF